jgi:deoxyxylulose-5-phosphate synthase
MLDVPGWCDSQRLPKAVAVAKALKNTTRVKARIAILSNGTTVLEALKRRTGLMLGLSTTVADPCFAKPLDLEVDGAARHFCRA